MPIYDLECPKCHQRIYMVLMGMDEKKVCPFCRQGDMVRLPSAPNIKVKDGTPKFHKRGHE